MSSNHQFISEFKRLVGKAKSPSFRSAIKGARPKISSRATKVLIFSPHPDDECITGALALRLLREAKWNVVNIAVTLGSKRSRQQARRRELGRACAKLGFQLIVPVKRGLEHVNLETRKQNPARWEMAVRTVAAILARHCPRVIFFPHERDWNRTHIGVHFLVLDALKKMPCGFECFTVETEFWGQMENPNLLVESNVEDVGELVAALACHAGEVRRNPYHKRLPAWMLDNVRRGAELIGEQGRAAPKFTFATIYRLRKWSRGRLINVLRSGKFLSRSKNPAGLFLDLTVAADVNRR